MPAETRASKRIKTSHPRVSPPPDPRPGYELHLQTLNALPIHEFRDAYIPPNLLAFRSPKLPNTEFKLEYYAAAELSKSYYNKCLQLLSETSEDDYRLSERGWNPGYKKKEMRQADMRYLIVRRHDYAHSTPSTAGSSANSHEHVRSDEDRQGRPPSSSSASSHTSALSSPTKNSDHLDHFGFFSYQLDDDWGADPVPILYIYEIHLGANLRGIGLGKHLMHLAKHIAITTKMHKIELSVFTRNAHAENFYRRLGYDTDETSPSVSKNGRKPDWLVLSLRLIPKGNSGNKSANKEGMMNV